MLVQQYLRRFNRELGRELAEVAPAALAQLRAYAWPGNIRELQSVLKQAMLRATGPILIPAFLPTGLAEQSNSTAPAPDASAAGDFRFPDFIRARLLAGSNDVYAETHRQLDRMLLSLALDFTDGNQRLAARVLGVARETLRQRLREAGLSPKPQVDSSDPIGDESATPP